MSNASVSSNLTQTARQRAGELQQLRQKPQPTETEKAALERFTQMEAVGREAIQSLAQQLSQQLEQQLQQSREQVRQAVRETIAQVAKRKNCRSCLARKPSSMPRTTSRTMSSNA
jgi:signal recognition particle GTPase